MVTPRAPDGASEQLAPAVELFNRDLDGILATLDTRQQNEFWMNMRGYALAEARGAGANAQLIADDRVNAEVKHAAPLGRDDRRSFWQILHDAADREMQATKSPKARHGGGSA